MQYEKLRQLFRSLRMTPLHPQWLITLNESNRFSVVAKQANGVVLDIGCSDQELKKYLPLGVTYIGMDYLDTASNLYETTPAVYGNAQQIPIIDGAIDTVVLMEVLEHLPNPFECFHEIHRILKPGGRFIFSVPFLYPIHDAPFDFQRFTIHGIHSLAKNSNFSIESETARGHPISTAAALCNLALVKTALDGFEQKRFHALLLFFLPLFIPLLNLSGWLFDKIKSQGTFMTLGYTFVLHRN